MIVSNTSKRAIEAALNTLNKDYKGNICFNRFEALNSNKTRFAVTLRVKDSRKRGAKLGYSGRHTIAASWHVCGKFIDLLFDLCPETKLRIRGRAYNNRSWYWEDWNDGSYINPVYASELSLGDG